MRPPYFSSIHRRKRTFRLAPENIKKYSKFLYQQGFRYVRPTNTLNCYMCHSTVPCLPNTESLIIHHKKDCLSEYPRPVQITTTNDEHIVQILNQYDEDTVVFKKEKQIYDPSSSQANNNNEAPNPQTSISVQFRDKTKVQETKTETTTITRNEKTFPTPEPLPSFNTLLQLQPFDSIGTDELDTLIRTELRRIEPIHSSNQNQNSTVSNDTAQNTLTSNEPSPFLDQQTTYMKMAYWINYQLKIIQLEGAQFPTRQSDSQIMELAVQEIKNTPTELADELISLANEIVSSPTWSTTCNPPTPPRNQRGWMYKFFKSCIQNFDTLSRVTQLEWYLAFEPPETVEFHQILQDLFDADNRRIAVEVAERNLNEVGIKVSPGPTYTHTKRNLNDPFLPAADHITRNIQQRFQDLMTFRRYIPYSIQIPLNPNPPTNQWPNPTQPEDTGV